MKIIGTSNIVGTYIKNTPSVRTSKRPQYNTESMEVSEGGRLFSELMTAARAEVAKAASPERLTELENQISAGSYSINADTLAGYIMDVNA